jgi:hypothetical protein
MNEFWQFAPTFQATARGGEHHAQMLVAINAAPPWQKETVRGV